MDETIFRAYSIRGTFGETLTLQDMLLIGRAAGTMLGSSGITHAVIGRDYRLSSVELSTALRTGLLSTGMCLTDIGPCPTPLLNFATDHLNAGAGLMVTASHNPPQYNGLKIRTDHTIQGYELRAIYQIAKSDELGQEKPHLEGRSGRLTLADPLDDYLDAIYCRTQARQAIGRRQLRLVVDAGNGAAGPVVPRLLEKLGCQVISLHCLPDGRFPNRVPDPTLPGALDELAARVTSEKANAGLAYDGDGDRLAMVDDRGQPVYADRLLTLLAKEALISQPGATVVYELSCTRALPETVKALGGKAVPCPVGYAFVHEAMRTNDALLGGETAGHLFFGDPVFQFDDAILATAKMVSLIARSAEPLSIQLARLPQYVRSPQHRLQCPDAIKDRIVDRVCQRFVDRDYQVVRLDGAQIDFEDGWALFRSSNTQPAVTLHCEATNTKSLEVIQGMMLCAVQEALAGLGLEMADAD